MNIVTSASKVCPRCGVEKTCDTFYKRTDGRLQNLCKPCWATHHTRSYNERNPSVRRQRKWLTRYGLTPADYNALYEAQQGLCAICEKPETGKTRRDAIRLLAVDHDHVTGRVRGLLCGNCNRILGEFEDRPERFERAAEYLRKQRT